MAPERRPSRELVQAGFQVWQSLSEVVGLRDGAVEATILFTELLGFPAWALEVGDDLGLELLRAVAAVVEPVIGAHDGRVVKRLACGHMAMFVSPLDGIEASLEFLEKLNEVEVAHHPPNLGAGLHTGQPHRQGRDLLGTDVNIAARVSEAARAGELLVSGPVLSAIPPEVLEHYTVARRRGFRGKGTPKALEVFRVTLA